VAPHLAARLVRLLMVWRHLDDEQSWVRIAAVCGYADQAHMTHDWVAFAGASPSVWLADEQLPFVQDDEANQPASWTA
jgi:AraC-like DNA-binding protein